MLSHCPPNSKRVPRGKNLQINESTKETDQPSFRSRLHEYGSTKVRFKNSSLRRPVYTRPAWVYSKHFSELFWTRIRLVPRKRRLADYFAYSTIPRLTSCHNEVDKRLSNRGGSVFRLRIRNRGQPSIVINTEVSFWVILQICLPISFVLFSK